MKNKINFNDLVFDVKMWVDKSTNMKQIASNNK